MTAAYLQAAERDEPQRLTSGARCIQHTPVAAGRAENAGAEVLCAIHHPLLRKQNGRHASEHH